MKRDKATGKERGGVDWNALRRRLEAARQELEQGLEPTPERKRTILKARARRLAEPRIEEKSDPTLDILVLTLADEKYGVETTCVREVYALKEYTLLPDASPFILGLVNVRGRILPLIDIKKLFDLPEKGLTDLNKVLIVRWQQKELGVLADAVLGLQQIPVGEIQPSPVRLEGTRVHCFRGVTKDHLAILDVGAIFSSQLQTNKKKIAGSSPREGQS